MIDKDSLCMYDIVFVPLHLESPVDTEASAYYMGLSYRYFRLSQWAHGCFEVTLISFIREHCKLCQAHYNNFQYNSR
jgi:hypothetical protein